MEKGNIIFKGKVIDEALNHYLSPINSHMKDIDQRTDRAGNQRAKVTNIKILNSVGVETNQISLGESFVVILEIKGNLKNAIIGVLIGNKSVLQICQRGISYESYPDKIDINGYLMVKCFFDSVPLVQGIYSIHTWVGLYKDVIDYVENAVELVIHESDIFNTGKILDPKVPCFTIHHWELTS